MKLKSIVMGCDHGGWELKEYLKQKLAEWGYPCTDIGTFSAESVDYPDFASAIAKAIQSGTAERGVLICGTGIGMSMAANKFPGIRAALCHDEFTARMSRQHNNANILVLGGRILGTELASNILKVWLTTEYERGRHQRRLDKISQIERENFKNVYAKTN